MRAGFVPATTNSAPTEGAPSVADYLTAAWCVAHPQDAVWCLANDNQQFAHFRALASATGIGPEQIHPATRQDCFATLELVFQPTGDLSKLAWERLSFMQEHPQAALVPLCGLVGQLASPSIMNSLTELALAPTFDCDALVCPSRAAATVVQDLWSNWGEYIGWRLGKKFIAPLHTPVIPHGIDWHSSARKITATSRAAQRQQLGAGTTDIILLVAEPLSFLAGSHPFAILQAAESAARQLGQRQLHLVFQGNFAPALMEKPLRALAAQLCRSARVHFITPTASFMPDGCWAGADIFLALHDNLAETFAHNLLEAMAVGLPTIATNWGANRDIVQQGETGLLIESFLPPASASQTFATQLQRQTISHAEWLSSSSQSTAFDTGAATQAIIQLASQPELRRKLGTAAFRRCQQVYDWQQITKQYEALWQAQLASARSQELALAGAWAQPPPAQPLPWQAFAGYASQPLTPHTQLQKTIGGPTLAEICQNPVNFFMGDQLLPMVELAKLAEHFSRSATIASLLAQVATTEHAAVWRSVGWLLKFGVLRVV